LWKNPRAIFIFIGSMQARHITYSRRAFPPGVGRQGRVAGESVALAHGSLRRDAPAMIIEY